jgi:DNA-binding response OmpR family regulator
MYAAALSHFGFETVIADDAARAIERARATHPDVIVTEVALPRHDGFRLLDDLKRDTRISDIPMIVVTSLVESAVRERAGRAGCAAVLIKPRVCRKIRNDGRLGVGDNERRRQFQAPPGLYVTALRLDSTALRASRRRANERGERRTSGTDAELSTIELHR